ncbi:MAG: DUF4912 domain-containing protein [Acidobacteria bacterium]|nr:DUF4912 domain-containing protein [Acidobacteriota bacterium]
MFVLRPSSPFKTAQLVNAQESATPEEASSAASTPKNEAAIPFVDAEPFIDLGLPVPASYATDIMRALVQDPFRVFIYWEVRDESLQALTRLFSAAEAQTFTTVLKLRDMQGGQEAFFHVGRRGRYWMTVFPDRLYQFEIGVQSPLHGYISLISSNVVHTPRGTISPVTADEAEYRLEPQEFFEILEKSGFGPEQSLNLTVAAMPGTALHEEALASTMDKLSDEVRAAILLAGSGGKLTAEMIDELPESLRELLRKLLEESSGELAATGLMHYLPEILRETIEDDSEWMSDHAHPLRLTPRFFVGASENAQWPEGEWHLPSLPRRPSSDEKSRRPDFGSSLSLRHLLDPRT